MTWRLVTLLVVGTLTLTACPQQGGSMTSGASEANTERFTAEPAQPGAPQETSSPSPSPSLTEYRTESPEEEPSIGEPPPSDGGTESDSCVPGTWSVQMPPYVKSLPIQGNKRYLSGSYIFTFDDKFGFTARYDDVTIRLRMQGNFVDVHNTWEETGTWVGGLEADAFDEALMVLGAPIAATAEESMTVLGIDDAKRLVYLTGTTFNMLDAYGLINGKIKTTQLSNDGSAIQAVGEVDCGLRVMKIATLGPQTRQLTLNKIS